jgi:SOS response regulatory protein OraA/RecX
MGPNLALSLATCPLSLVTCLSKFDSMDPYQTALSLALKKLSASDRFEAEIRSALGEHDSETVDRVIATLKQRRILDDARTARAIVDRRSGRRAIGPEKLRAEFLARGAPEEVVDECLSALSEDDRTERMRDALASKFTLAGDRNKAARFLLSRGFGEDEIEGALDAFFQADA